MISTNLKAYIGYSRYAGRQEGAVLIFANNAREAHTVGYQGDPGLSDEFIDFAVDLLKNVPHLYAEADQEKLANNVAHVIDNPASCKECWLWGDEIGEDGLCEDCRFELEQQRMVTQ